MKCLFPVANQESDFHERVQTLQLPRSKVSSGIERQAICSGEQRFFPWQQLGATTIGVRLRGHQRAPTRGFLALQANSDSTRWGSSCNVEDVGRYSLHYSLFTQN